MDDPAGPPPRPRTWAELGFSPRRSVQWFSPRILAVAAGRVVLSAMFGAYLDKRELQHGLPADVLSDHADQPEVWFDYVSDLGDGFDATYTVAWLTAQRQLAVEGLDATLPRAALLLLGGDEVYPVAEAEEYEDRFVGPYRAAIPWTEEHHPDLLAIPGNHDWYDGLTGFMRIFGQHRWIGGRRTRQSRSYFAVELPHRWWLWGIDIQFDAYVDEPQIRYFREAARRMRPGDRVVLCTAKPSWTDTGEEPEAYRNLGFVERNLVPPGVRVPLMISGDTHHYARYASADGSQKLTAGGGGAFLHGTSTLDRVVDVPSGGQAELVAHTLAACYPSPGRSRRLQLRSLLLARFNPRFLVVPAVLHAFLLWANQFGVRSVGSRAVPLDEAARGFGWQELALGGFRSPVPVVVVLVLLGALVGFAKPPPRLSHGRWRLPAKAAMGTAHTFLQLLVVTGVAWVALRVAAGLAEGTAFTVLLFLLVAVLGGLAASVALGAYLTASLSLLRSHGNEVFSAIRVEDHKNFLRIHLDRDGTMVVHALGVPSPCRAWHPDPDAADPEASWVAPAEAPRVELIERVVVR